MLLLPQPVLTSGWWPSGCPQAQSLAAPVHPGPVVSRDPLRHHGLRCFAGETPEDKTQRFSQSLGKS